MNNRGIRHTERLHQPECVTSLGRHITRGKLDAHRGRASGVNCAGFQGERHEAPPLSATGPPTCQAAWDAEFNLAGALVRQSLDGIMTITLMAFLFLCFGDRENALLMDCLCVCVFKLSIITLNWVIIKSHCPESLCVS